MASTFDQHLAEDFERALAGFKETIVRRRHGRPENPENVQAIVERDSRAAGHNTSDGGLEENDGKLRAVRKWLVEVSASQAVNYDDRFVIDNKVWRVLGDSIGEDGGSKTFVVVSLQPIRDRQPQSNRG